MRVVTILGTRPEIIRLSQIIPKLDQLCQHTVVYTGQNYSPELKDVFFQELGVRKPDIELAARGTFAEQLSILVRELEPILEDIKPHRFLVLGDTNSSLGAIVAKRLGIPVFHMEAGNRAHDDRIPEEVNRKIIDACTDVYLPYNQRSRENLLREGVPNERIIVTGNPIAEVVACGTDYKTDRIPLGMQPGLYFLVTLHRQENVDDQPRLLKILTGLNAVAAAFTHSPIIVSTHPRLRQRLSELPDLPEALHNQLVRFTAPFGFGEFLRLENGAKCVISDSGTVQEECCILGTPLVTLRDTTERPETLECGSNLLCGPEPEAILAAVRLAITLGRNHWELPPEYNPNREVSATVVKAVLGTFTGKSRYYEP